MPEQSPPKRMSQDGGPPVELTISANPDFIYAFDRTRRFVYANPAMLRRLGRPESAVLGKTSAELDDPLDLGGLLDSHADRVFGDGVTVEGEASHRSSDGHASFLFHSWGPVRGEDGSIALVIGVSRDTSARGSREGDADAQALMKSEARLRASTDLVGIGIYAWDPVSGELEWDERVRAMWGLPAEAPVDMAVFEAGIFPDDLDRVREAIAACVDPAGDGRYDIEYRVTGRDDGVLRHIATLGQTRFAQGRAVGFIGAARDVTAQRHAEEAVRLSEARFRSFAEHSSNLLWMVDPSAGMIIYRSAAYKQLWGVPGEEMQLDLATWMMNVHPDDRDHVDRALTSVRAGESAQFEYRIIRPADGAVRWLRDTSFPIPDEDGRVTRIGGITEDQTPEKTHLVYIVGASAAEARKLGSLVRSLGYRPRSFESAAAFLGIAAVLVPGCVLVDLRNSKNDGLTIPRGLKARSVSLPTVALDAPGKDVAAAVAAMKGGAIDYVIVRDEASLRTKLGNALAECHGAIRPTRRNEDADTRVARLTPRERDVLIGLVNGGTNKKIGKELGISPRTVELHRAQIMIRLDANGLTELLQIAFAAGVRPSSVTAQTPQKPQPPALREH